MNEHEEAEQKLERLLDRTLRELPLRRAPPSLESRVLGEIERREARPWWQLSFVHWPELARVGFVLACGGLIWLSAFMGIWPVRIPGALHDPVALTVTWAREAAAFTDALGELVAALTRAIPPVWLSGGLAMSAALYSVLFGLGIAAYRILYLNSRTLGNIES